jgi:hypothetical protein
VLSVPVDSEPLVPRAPLQSPLATQEVALVVVHDSVEDCPCVIAVGEAVSDSVGGGVAGDTVTVVLPLPVPPSPVQVSPNVVVCVRAGVVKVPAVPRAPLQPPDAVHDWALVEDQVRFEVPPLAICAGLAEIVTVGAGNAPTATVAVCVTDPPAPVQLSEYE